MAPDIIQTPFENNPGQEDKIPSITNSGLATLIGEHGNADIMTRGKIENTMGKVNKMISDFNTAADEQVLIGESVDNTLGILNIASGPDKFETQEGAKTVLKEDYKRNITKLITALNKCIGDHSDTMEKDTSILIKAMGELLDVDRFVSSLPETYMFGDGKLEGEPEEVNVENEKGDNTSGVYSVGGNNVASTSGDRGSIASMFGDKNGNVPPSIRKAIKNGEQI